MKAFPTSAWRSLLTCLPLGFKKILLCFFLATLTLISFAQSKRITGVIKDNTGNPVAGASVTVKGSAIGVTSDGTGAFAIDVPSNTSMVVISSVGFQQQEISISNRSQVDIALAPSNNQLDQVVVVGYGTQRKATVTGSVAMVKGSELDKSPTMNLSNSLGGTFTGYHGITADW